MSATRPEKTTLQKMPDGTTRPSIKYKLLKNLIPIKTTEQKKLPALRRHTHKISRVRQKGKKDIWFYKRFTRCDTDDAQLCIKICVFVGEFHRLIDPHHPKVRLVKSSHQDKNYCGVITKNIEGFKSFDTIDNNDLKKMIQKDEIRGLGKTVANALLSLNTDLLPQNICLTKTGDTICYDNDWCYPDFRFETKNRFNFNSADLKALPNLPKARSKNQFIPDNWLDRYDARKLLRLQTHGLTNILKQSKTIQKEIHETFLRRVLLGKSFLKIFAECLFDNPKDVSIFYAEADRLTGMLHDNVFKLPTFREYLKSDAAKDEANRFLNEITHFRFTKNFEFKNALPAADITPAEMMMGALEALRNKAARIAALPAEKIAAPAKTPGPLPASQSMPVLPPIHKQASPPAKKIPPRTRQIRTPEQRAIPVPVVTPIAPVIRPTPAPLLFNSTLRRRKKGEEQIEANDRKSSVRQFGMFADRKLPDVHSRMGNTFSCRRKQEL